MNSNRLNHYTSHIVLYKDYFVSDVWPGEKGGPLEDGI